MVGILSYTQTLPGLVCETESCDAAGFTVEILRKNPPEELFLMTFEFEIFEKYTFFKIWI